MGSMTTARQTLTLIVLILTLFASPRLALAGACPHAPAPRLKADAAAVVSRNIVRLNLRALPAVDTGVVGLLSPGARLTIISGPSCNGGYNWWRVETSFGARGWVAEGAWEAYYVIPEREAERPVDPFEWSCPAHLPLRCYLP